MALLTGLPAQAIAAVADDGAPRAHNRSGLSLALALALAQP